jgi:hypothetical protein
MEQSFIKKQRKNKSKGSPARRNTLFANGNRSGSWSHLSRPGVLKSLFGGRIKRLELRGALFS